MFTSKSQLNNRQFNYKIMVIRIKTYMLEQMRNKPL